MVKRESGASSLGCLFTMLVVAVVCYFGVNVGEVYLRYYKFQDVMRQEVRFAAHNADTLIVRHLRAHADSLGLPEAAANVTIQRDARHIEMESEYYEHLELPLMVREVRFNPHAEGVF